ncbi:hypothetical protein [Egibacter rhizosphaerae]|uniref:hypothetical protein n=1 Tax=Egibacter rhizosphaerae TaxID=1670831 RepID=UPI0013F17015|nr:hypothetical protein [Egibacter rhizosphaerae]
MPRRTLRPRPPPGKAPGGALFVAATTASEDLRDVPGVAKVSARPPWFAFGHDG